MTRVLGKYITLLQVTTEGVSETLTLGLKLLVSKFRGRPPPGPPAEGSSVKGLTLSQELRTED